MKDTAISDRRSATTQPMISVVIPVRNEERCISRTLDGVLKQDYPTESFEVLVVDNQSTDHTREIVGEYTKHHENVRLLQNDQRWSSSGRNLGVNNASGDYVIIVDGHCELGDGSYLTKLADAFKRSGADCIGRPQPQATIKATALQRAISTARSSRLGHHPDSFVYSSGERVVPAHSVAVAYRRSVFDKVGLFDETFDACEDVELNHRVDQAGLRCFFTDKVKLPYVPRNSLRGLFKQLVRYGRGRMRLLRKHPNTFSWKSFLPALFVLGVVSGALLAPFSVLLGWVYLAVLGSYLAIVVGSSIAHAASLRDVGVLPWLPFVFTTIHISAGVGIWLEIANMQRRPTQV